MVGFNRHLLRLDPIVWWGHERRRFGLGKYRMGIRPWRSGVRLPTRESVWPALHSATLPAVVWGIGCDTANRPQRSLPHFLTDGPKLRKCD